MNASLAGRDRGRAVIVEQAVDIHCAPEVVFDYCADLTREPEWNPRLTRVAKLTEGPEAVGTRYAAAFVPGDPMLVECVRFERPSAWESVGNSRHLRAAFSGKVQPTRDGARLVMRMELQPRWLLAWAAPLLRPYMQRQLRRDVATIKARLEDSER